MEGYTLQTVSSKLRPVIASDGEALTEICHQLKYIINESKLWRVEDGETMLERNQDRTTLLEKRLAKTCTETTDIKSMRWLYQQIHKDVGFYCIKNTCTKTPSHDPYIGTVLDIMSQYDQNCRRKEELENMINQVHKKINKHRARQFCSEPDMDIPATNTACATGFTIETPEIGQSGDVYHNQGNTLVESGGVVCSKSGENTTIENEPESKENVQDEYKENVKVISNKSNENPNVDVESKEVIHESAGKESVKVENKENVHKSKEITYECTDIIQIDNKENVHVERKENAQAKSKENCFLDSKENAFVRDTPSKRRPLLSLNLSQCKGDNSSDSVKSNPLTRVRSPVLCAYLQKRKALE